MLPNIVLEKSNGEKYNLSSLNHHVILVVNTATGCGLANQFHELEELYQLHKDEGFTVLGFPCNQFAHQEPIQNEKMQEFCQLTYDVHFPLHTRLKVNGENTHPLYQWLKSEQSGVFSTAIKWNFTKFLIDRNGNVVKRYAPQTSPKTLETDIEKLLQS